MEVPPWSLISLCKMNMNKEKLILMVKEHPELYNNNHPGYHDLQLKRASWKIIARELKYPVDNVRKTWVSLRDTYRRTYKKHKGKKPPIEEHKYLKASHYGDKMSFLYPLMKASYPLVDGGSNASSDHENASSEWIPVLSPSVFKEDGDAGEMLPEFSPKPPEPEYNEDDERPKSAASDDFPDLETVGQDSVVVSLLKHVLKERQVTDDIGKFFDCMATTVRTFTPQQRNTVKAKVFDIVSKMELEMLNAPSTSKAYHS